MRGHYILDENGNPQPCQDIMAWARWFNTADRRVASTVIGEVEVSTVFLALDHSFDADAPLLYETLVMGGEHDGEITRYSTRQQAEDGHAAVCAELRAAD
jgi:hypothetical protein